MYQFRHFLNTDIHRIVHLWRACAPNVEANAGGLGEPLTDRVLSSISASQLEESVFSRTFFENEGCLLAERDKELLALALVGFGPDEYGQDTSPEDAIFSRVLVDPGHLAAEDLVVGLLETAQRYAVERGAVRLWYGSKFPTCPFLAGMYGGALVPGLLSGESRLATQLQNFGFAEVDRVVSFENSLESFRPVVDRAQMLARRNFNVVIEADPAPDHWYHAVCFGAQNCVDFQLVDRKNKRLCGNLKFWEIEPLGSQWGRRTAGLVHLEIDAEVRRLGLATLLLGDAFRQLGDLGFRFVETQVPISNDATCGLFDKLGFRRIGVATQYRKDLRAE